MKKIVNRVLLLFILFAGLFSTQHVYSEQKNELLVIYSMAGEEHLRDVRILDTLLGQFNETYQMKAAEDVTAQEIKDAQKIIYYGTEEQELADSLGQLLSEREKVFVIGDNTKQIPSFSWLQDTGEAVIDVVTYKNIQQPFPEERIARKIETDPNNVQAWGTKETEKFPIVAQYGALHYFASNSLLAPFDKTLFLALQDFLTLKRPEKTKYLRLEDIHPMVDSNLLKKQAKYLKEKNIPYMVAVIPVYTNKSGEEIRLKDKPKLVKTLKYIQDNGGSIILHGYKHQYRSSETGEGFEFWDVEHDRPILQPAEEKAKVREDFSSDAEYEAFYQEGLTFERQYITNAIENGVKELTDLGIYPLAFEAPHYTMSEQGYEILAEHFSTYVGRLQTTSITWQSEYQGIGQSQPKFLHGLVVHPETLGYLDPHNPDSLTEMKAKIQTFEQLPGSYLAAFYHPYLGLDGLKSVVGLLEPITDAKWLDLKATTNNVQTKDVKIESRQGAIETVFYTEPPAKTNKSLLMISGLLGVGLVATGVIYFRQRRSKVGEK